uniref:Glycosyltransferase n=1 Tax=Geobacter sp. (strain M21) TaxID=443144 RepID=C6E5A7_GEOSM
MTADKHLLLIEPNLRSPSGHYCDFVRALGSRATDAVLEVFAHPEADAMLERMAGVQVCRQEPRVGRPLAEWRTIARETRAGNSFLVLTADARHAAAVTMTAASSGKDPKGARLFFHRPPTTVRDQYLFPLTWGAREHALAVTSTEKVAESLRGMGYRRVVCVPYPAQGPATAPEPVPFSHLLMAGAARLNKGLDLVAGLAGNWAGEGRSVPLMVQVSQKHADRHGRREGEVVRTLLACGYQGLRADETVPDRGEYLSRFKGALVLAPYAREQFASQVSGIVLDALLHGSPVIATSGTWPGAQVERFGAGDTIAERTPEALSAAVDRVLSDWDGYSARACEAARTLALEHDPARLLRVLLEGEGAL